MKNLAGNKDCDIDIKKELAEAGIPFEEHEFLKRNSEVPSAVLAYMNGWTFKRAWYYWVASSDDNLLLFENADKLHEKFGQEVRVSGHCGCPAPREWYNKEWNLGVNLYHVDSQEGLNALAQAIRDQATQ
jgi:hypothetical protein